MDRSHIPSILTMKCMMGSPNKCRNPQPPMQEKILLLRKYSELRSSPTKRNTMSVTEPADSGSSQAASQILQVENIATIGSSWAQMMEEEEAEPQEFDDNEQEGTDEPDGGMSPERRRHIPETAPFRVQITNLDKEHCPEELIYYFGGEKAVKKCDFLMEEGKAEFEFHARDGLLTALQKTDVLFKGRSLKVYVLRNQQQSPAKRQEYRQSQERQDVRYNSQSSLNSDRQFRNERASNGRHNNHQPQHYGTMPAGGFYGNRGGHRGGYPHGYYNNNNNSSRDNSFRAPRNPPQFDRQHSQPQYQNNHHNRSYNDHNQQHGGGPLQRSGSYQSYRNNDYNYHHNRQGGGGGGGPGSVARSRTDSHHHHHNSQLDNYSRASSRLSIATSVSEEPARVQKKVSANPFGDAKPVDTQAKLLEAEKRLTEKESQKSSEATGDHSVEEVGEVQQHHQNHQNYQHHQHHQQKFGNYFNAGYNARGGYNQNFQQHHQNHPKRHYENQQHQEHQQVSPSYGQGAPPGSVVIKKRESVELEKHQLPPPPPQKEDEVPPVDPIHYPLDNNEKSSSEQPAEQPLTHHQKPPHHGNFRGNRGRPTMKPYSARGGGHNLQKSATVGAIGAKGDGGEVLGEQHIQNQKPHPKRYQNQNRRASLSGSESGRAPNAPNAPNPGAPGAHPMRGAKRGGRVGRGGANISRGGGARRAEGEHGALQELSHQEKENKHNKSQEQQSPGAQSAPAQHKEKEERKPEPSSEPAKKEPNVGAEPKEPVSTAAPGAPSDASATPKKKKDNKKKKEKKEAAKTPQLGDNKYAVLANAPQ